VTAGIYLHIPFCRIRCPYCDFNTYTGMADRIPSYVDALIGELELRCAEQSVRKDQPLRSVYFGGGTPSLLDPDHVEQILAAISAHFPVADDLEVTLEANPGTVDRNKLAAFAAAGVSRLTLGVQTFNPALLSQLGRLHSVEESLKAISEAASCDFDSINIDLMYGLSQQSEADWANDLTQALSQPVSHLSLYNLTVEEGTPFARYEAEGQLDLPGEENCRAMYLAVLDATEAAGFSRYEVSNFAKPGAQCHHNQLYWDGASWLGLGAGAHGFTAEEGDWGRRWWNVKRPGPYIASTRSGQLPEEGHEVLTANQAADESLMLGLRRSEGLDVARFQGRFGADPMDWKDPSLDSALRDGLLQLDGNHLSASKDGVIIVDYLISRLAASLDSRVCWDTLGRS
jgi:oxygen-independent coproporphyrinogen-3 oxidase